MYGWPLASPAKGEAGAAHAHACMHALYACMHARVSAQLLAVLPPAAPALSTQHPAPTSRECTLEMMSAMRSSFITHEASAM